MVASTNENHDGAVEAATASLSSQEQEILLHQHHGKLEEAGEVQQENDNNELKKSSKAGGRKSLSQRISSSLQGTTHGKAPLIELELQNVTYAPMLPKKNRLEILSGVSTCIRPGQLTAWMGPSGSGKTSLISVAADLVNREDLIDGTILVNGDGGRNKRIPKQLVGVVWQDDLLLSNLTVQENVFFAARLKTPESISNEQVQHVVRETMVELGLWHVRDRLVGNPLGSSATAASAASRRGISGGERKRVSVALELVVRPSLLLLDEPTSGLDATTAFSLMETLKDLASNDNISVVVVIHQPRTAIYNVLDHLLVLSRGHVIYDGPPLLARDHLESCPGVAPLPPYTAIADWMMDVIIDQERLEDENGQVSLAQYWQAKASMQQQQQQQGAAHAPKRRGSEQERFLQTLDELHSAPTYSVGFWTQLWYLTLRTCKQQRGERLTLAGIVLQLAYLLFTALFWWRMPDTTEWIFARNSLLFFMIIAQANGIVVNAVTVFQREQLLLRRERAKKLYGVSAYFVAKTTSDMTNNVILPVLYGMICYWTAGYRPTAAAYLKFVVAFYMALSTAQSMGLWMSIAIPNTTLSLILAPPITLFFMIMGGFYIPFSNMHIVAYYLSWTSFARYGFSALLLNEFVGRDIPCANTDNAISIGGVDECPLPGEAVVTSLGLYGVAQEYWFNVVMLMAFQLVFRVAAYVSLRRSK